MSPSHADSDKHTVMIVDDDRTMVGLLTTLLELDGYRVAQWDDRSSFVQHVDSAQPDLLLMDVYLKSHDGIELVRELRRSPAHASLPVIMTSGMDMSEQSLAAGADSFVLKPYDPDVLLQTIRSQLERSGGAETDP